MPNEAQAALQEILDWFDSITPWIAFAAEKAQEIIIGTIPEDDYDQVYQFADEWGKLAQAHSDFLSASQAPGQVISGNWSGDATAAAYGDWYLQLNKAAAALQQAASELQMDVQGYGLQL